MNEENYREYYEIVEAPEMNKMDKRLDDQMKGIVDSMHDLLDMWMTQISSDSSDSLADNYPKELPNLEELITYFQRWREHTRIENECKALLKQKSDANALAFQKYLEENAHLRRKK